MERQGKIIAVCRSDRKGTAKYPVESAELVEDWGIEKDAHAGKWHRQVSLLSVEKVDAFRQKGIELADGAFGENLLVEGFDLRTIPVGSRFRIGRAVLELTQIGKECHSDCAIRRATGDCIMPREGVFAKVIQGGTVRPGDSVTLMSLEADRPFTAAVITLSDRGYKGVYEDESGPLIVSMLKEAGYDVIETLLLPDVRELLEKALCRLCDQRQVNVIFTTGGTGFSPRDVTPEATLAVCDRQAPGIAEALRAHSLEITKHAMLSRQASGIRKRTLIINFPGSPKACRENLSFLLGTIEHGLGLLRGTADN